VNMIYNLGGVELTNEYWDCECPDDNYQYIHAVSERQCDKCGVLREDQPYAHVNEVVAAGLPVKEQMENSEVNQ